MIVNEWCKAVGGDILRFAPDEFRNFRLRAYRTVWCGIEHERTDHQIGFVGCPSGVPAPRRRWAGQTDAKLLGEFADERIVCRLARFRLATGQHEPGGSALSDKQKAVAIVADDRRDDADFRPRQFTHLHRS